MRTYSTKSYRKTTGCGELNITIAYKADGGFHFILAGLENHSNQCQCAYSEALANLLTFSLRRAKDDEIDDIAKQLVKQRCQYGTQSCPNAIGEVVKEAFKKEA